MPAQKIAIIGGGVSGLTSIKACLDAGLQPTCFEQQSWLGGVWKYSGEVQANIPSVHNCTVTNTSKVMTSFSDFPMPKEFPNYMTHRLIQRYLEMYATRFGLQQYVQFNTVVVKLSRSDDHAETGRWVVSYRKLLGTGSEFSEIQDEIFDAVMVCNGHYWNQAKPKIPGIERFKGAQVHSGDYRTFHPYVGKRVVVVGGANSAGDIACELSHHASQVYLSPRRGCYIMQRLASNGRPSDMQLSRATTIVSLSVKKILASGLVNNMYNLANFGLEPTGSLFVTQFPIVNDELPHRVITGSIIVKDDIKEVTETSVIFKSGDVLENIDALIFATGFKLDFPFAKDIIGVKEEYYASLYKHIFLPEVERNTLAVIGTVGVSGPLLPIVEMQARVAVEVFAGRCTLPSKNDMVEEIDEREQYFVKIGVGNASFMRVSFIDYLDELAAMIGAKPNLWSIFKQDPKLAFLCVFGPTVPAQYRLQGPNSSQDAQMIIKSAEEQYLYPIRTRKCLSSSSKGNRSNYFFELVLVACVSVIVFVVFGSAE